MDALIAGHDHNLQHIVKIDELDVEYVISGAGGKFTYSYTQVLDREDDNRHKAKQITRTTELSFTDPILRFLLALGSQQCAVFSL